MGSLDRAVKIQIIGAVNLCSLLTSVTIDLFYCNAGAATGTVVYDPAEPWSLANVVTMCGIQSAIPIPYTGLMSDDGQGHVSVASRRLLTTNGQNSVR